MKKVLSLLFALCFAVSTYGQEEHLKFMGIPLNGTINAFENKLSAKGVKPDIEFNKNIDLGRKTFKGIFAGYEALICIYYTPSTKTVYRAKACISSEDEDYIEKVYDKLKYYLTEKYSDELYNTEEYEDHPSLSIITSDGIISLYRAVYEKEFYKSYSVHIDYDDKVNSLKNKQSEIDDI